MVRPDPKKIIVPRKHGEILVEPAFSQLVPAVLTPPQNAAAGKRVQAREQMLKAAAEWAALTEAPAPPSGAAEKSWIITGHQVEFYHPGVWAKVLGASELARRANESVPNRAIAFDILVDHDVIDRIGFDVPVEKGNGGWARTWEGFSERPSLPAESLSAPTLDAFLRWDATLAEYPATQTDSMAYYLSALRHGLGQEAGTAAMPYTRWMSRGRAGFERSFDLQVHHVPATWVCRGPVWDSFVQSWMDNAEKWTEVYNRHLAAYRQRQGVKSLQHPMPDLHRDVARGEFELPFWVSEPGKPRERLMFGVPPAGGQGGQASKSHSAVASSPPKGGTPNDHIRPRALTFTMFVRVYLADLFIHGIGGALYDQITDGILEELFHVVPPYTCVSAAWLLPLGQSFPAEDLSALKWRRHHVQHNPQLAIDPFTALRSEVAELIMERKNLVEQISVSIAEARQAERAIRRDWFARLHQINEQLHQKSPRILPNLDRQIEDALAAMEQNKVLLWREWFFALHSRASLELLQKAVANSS